MNVSEYIVKYLEDVQEIERAYVIVGGATLWLDKALGQAKKLKFTFTNHEQPAVMSADGFARISGKPGIAIVTNGPALTNTVTAMAQAYVDSSPVVLFTGDSGLSSVRYEREKGVRQYGTQDVRTDLIMQGVTKKFYTLEDPAMTAKVITEAFYIAREGRPGPVCINIPINIQSSECPCAFPPAPYQPEEKKIDSKSIRKVLESLAEAERPLILAGQGVRLSESTEMFNEFVKLMDIPVVNSRMGIDTIETDSRYFAGRCGNHGYRSAHFALETCDKLLILGSRLAPNTTGYNVSAFSNQSYKMLVECDPNEFTKFGTPIDELIEGNINDFLSQALEILKTGTIISKHTDWVDCCEDWKKRYPIMQEKYYSKDVINSYLLVDTVTKAAKENDIVIADTGSSCSIVAQTWNVKKGQRVLISGGLSAMGYWATAMGLAQANKKDSNVICFVGDGSLQMNIHEYATIEKNHIPIKLFVVSNDGYQFVRMSQSSYDINPTFGTDSNDGVPIPNIEKVTKAYALEYMQCSDPAKLEETVNEVLSKEGPVVCEVFVSKDLEVEPRIRSFANADGTFRMPTYENLFPWLDEDVLAEEMKKPFQKLNNASEE